MRLNDIHPLNLIERLSKSTPANELLQDAYRPSYRQKLARFAFWWVQFLPQSRRLWPYFLALSLLLLLVTSALDLATGYEVSLTTVYLLPVLVASSTLGLRQGLLFALACAVLASVTRLINGQHYSNAFIPVWNAAMRFGVYAMSVLLLQALQEALRHEIALAREDHLTGIPNRRAFFEAGEAELSRARRYGRLISLAFVDADDFKAVNDRLGHEVGDAVLRTVANTLVSSVRSVDTVARLGGDEFVVLLVEAGPTEALTAMERASKRLVDTMARLDVPVTFSIGVVTFQTFPDSVDDAIRAADEVMYQIKRAGGQAVRSLVWDERAKASALSPAANPLPNPNENFS